MSEYSKDFGEAIRHLKAGGKAEREGWNGKGLYVELHVPTVYEEHDKMDLPYVYIKTIDDLFVPWLASQTDMLAEDWRLF